MVFFVILLLRIIRVKRELSIKNFIAQEGNFFSNVEFKVYSKNEKRINLRCDKIKAIDKNNYILHNSISNFELSNGETGSISANTTNIEYGDQTKYRFIGNVKLKTQSGLSAQTEEALADLDKKIIEGSQNVLISHSNATVVSRQYLYNMGNNTLTLVDDVNGSFKKSKIKCQKLTVFFEDGTKTIKTLEAIGNAVCNSENYSLNATQILYSVDSVVAKNNAILLYKKDGVEYNVSADFMSSDIDNNGILKNTQAEGHLMIKTKNIAAQADKGIMKGDKITLFNNVVISGKNGNILGENATLDIKNEDVFIDKSSGVIKNGTK